MGKFLVLTAFLLAGFSSALAQNYKLHPLYIYSFTRYVQWPEAYTKGDFEITVLGESAIIEELNKMAEIKKINDRTIKVNKINSVSEFKKCNILYLPAGKSNLLSEVLAKIANQPVLIITEEPGAGLKGSDINFIIKDGKLAFELNQAAVNRQNLKVSNELIRLAIVI